MKVRHLGIAGMVAAASLFAAAAPTKAATVLNFSGSQFASQTGLNANPDDLSSFPAGFPVPNDRNGTVYITGLGTNVVSQQFLYEEDVQMQGTGAFSFFSGVARLRTVRFGQDPLITVMANRGEYDVAIEFRNPRRNAFAYLYDQAFTEKLDPNTGRSMEGNPWDTVTYSIVYAGRRDGISGSSDDVVGGADFSMSSNNQVVAPIVTPPVSAVPEPATWAMMIMGLGFVGGVMRRRKSVVNFA